MLLWITSKTLSTWESSPSCPLLSLSRQSQVMPGSYYQFICETDQSTESDFSPLFISTKKAKNSVYHNPVVKRTVANWLLKMLELCGIDTTKFKTHSLRSSSRSKVANEGIKVGDILSMGSWSSESIWQNFYHKRGKSPGEEFQPTLLSNSKDSALKRDDTG